MVVPLYVGSDEATPRILGLVLGPSLKEEHREAKAHPEMGNKAGAGSRARVR